MQGRAFALSGSADTTFEITFWLHFLEDAVHAGFYVAGGQVLAIPSAQYHRHCHYLIDVFEFRNLGLVSVTSTKLTQYADKLLHRIRWIGAMLFVLGETIL
jgi:hypothetical protein